MTDPNSQASSPSGCLFLIDIALGVIIAWLFFTHRTDIVELAAFCCLFLMGLFLSSSWGRRFSLFVPTIRMVPWMNLFFILFYPLLHTQRSNYFFIIIQILLFVFLFIILVPTNQWFHSYKFLIVIAVIYFVLLILIFSHTFSPSSAFHQILLTLIISLVGIITLLLAPWILLYIFHLQREKNGVSVSVNIKDKLIDSFVAKDFVHSFRFLTLSLFFYRDKKRWKIVITNENKEPF